AAGGLVGRQARGRGVLHSPAHARRRAQRPPRAQRRRLAHQTLRPHPGPVTTRRMLRQESSVTLWSLRSLLSLSKDHKDFEDFKAPPAPKQRTGGVEFNPQRRWPPRWRAPPPRD